MWFQLKILIYHLPLFLSFLSSLTNQMLETSRNSFFSFLKWYKKWFVVKHLSLLQNVFNLGYPLFQATPRTSFKESKEEILVWRVLFHREVVWNSYEETDFYVGFANERFLLMLWLTQFMDLFGSLRTPHSSPLYGLLIDGLRLIIVDLCFDNSQCSSY